MAKYSHMLDLSFIVISDKENWEDLTLEENLSALEERIAGLRANPDEAAGAFGFSDTYKMEDKRR